MADKVKDLSVDFEHDTTYGGSLWHRLKMCWKILCKKPVHNRIKGIIFKELIHHWTPINNDKTN